MSKKNHSLALKRVFSYYAGRLGFYTMDSKDTRQTLEELDSGFIIRPIQPFYCEENLSNASTNPVEQIRSRESIRKRLKCDKIELHPYVVHHLFDAAIFSDHIFSREAHHLINKTSPLKLKNIFHPKEVQKAALAHTFFASIYWGHWVSFELPTQLILGELAPLISYRNTSKYKDENHWKALLPIQKIDTAECFLADEILIATGTSESVTCIKRHKQIRNIVGIERSKMKRRLFLIRPSGGSSRVISNQMTLISALAREGYEVVDPEQLEFAELLSLCKDAEEIISIEGSHLIFTMYLIRRDGLIVVLQPPSQVGFMHNDACHFLGIATAVFIGQPSASKGDDFSINITEFLPFLERARNWAAQTQQELVDYSGSIC